ncbi:transmembrane protein, putative (macronuclear) [Tetrahymena thermophila SB210]|uniref:Transmembrane protein, putative n=1 Tax=Tetrahymena thermophila (strain SB210) TaxID=312017 RepID=Q23QK4_TETTS|nr:transmembrane protein, putative [Tetrahymena thermophila SB210]EAR98884.2 transmembrane protein, putative [Tetrahymena thermophila SB210]|eukprot:XP_001019129.2 transmembrane protein, putative [Tetrahymena thermophila SB210]
MGKTNPFESSYLQVITFEKKLEKSYSLFCQTINLKLQILSMMKQKHIVATKLISKIETMQSQITQLKENLNYLIQLNDDSLDLLNLQALFLENLSFSEKDINLLQVNKYKKKNNNLKYLNRQNENGVLSSMINSDKFDEKTCIIFASYKDTETLTINQVSSNFSNLFCFTSRDHIYDKNIESIIPLAFHSVHKFYIKQYLEDSITCDIYSNDTNQQQEQNEQDNENDDNLLTPINQRQGYQFNQSKYLSENQTGMKNKNYQLQNCKMNQQIIFASLNQMFILPIKIDIKTNEYKENGTFGLVAKIKQINEEYQYILFNETDLSVIGLTQQMHEIFFPNCNSLQKINMRSIFPFLIGTQNKTKIEDSHIQNNEMICNTTNTKKQFHVNLTDDMQYILRGQLKNKLKIKNKFSFIIIQQADVTNNALNTTYRSVNRLNKSKPQQEISSYSFNYVELSVRKIKYHRVNNISYVEIVKIKQLNPASQAQIILQEITNIKKQYIYSQFFEHPSQLQNIISDLELNQNVNSNLQFNSFYSQLQYSCRDFNQGNQLLQIKENDTPIDFYKQQQLLKTLGDESTNLEQIKLVSNRIENDDFNCQSDETSRFTLNQFREQKALQNLNEKLQLNQLQQIQSNIAQEQTFIQSFQENQISNSDLQIKEDFANKNNHQNPIEVQLNKSNTSALPSHQKSNKIINIELTSPNNSFNMNINSNQQSLAHLSDQNLDVQQVKSHEFISNKIKENIYLDIEASNDEISKKYNNTINPLKISKNPNKIIKSNSFRKSQITNTLNDALNDREKKKLMKNSYQHNNINYIQKEKKKEQVQDIIYDIASSTSQNSYYTPVKRQLTQIMEDSSILKVIKLIKIIGVICFAVMVGITWLQFNSMYQYMSSANQDYEDFGWPTTYSSSLSDILKNKNIQFLTNYTRMNFTDIHQKQLFYDQIQQNMENTFSDVLRLLALLETASTNREVFNRVIGNKMNFYFGKLYNTQLLNSTTSNSIDLVFQNYSSTLQYSITLSVQNIFRYINNLGNGRPEFYLIQNQLEAISKLEYLQQQIKEDQSEKQEYIQDELYIIIMILVLINTFCVMIIIPLYFYIQKERDSIIYLFTTFPIQKLDNLIKKIQDSYFSINTSSIYQNQNNQIISDTLLQLEGIDNSALDLQTLSKVYQLRSYLLQNIAMHFNVLLMKARPRFKPMKPEIYYDYLQTLIEQQEDISKDIQWIINTQYSDQRFNQDLYDNFFFSAFKTNLCEDFKNYPQFNTNPKKVNVDLCTSPQQKFLQQGFSVAYKSLFSMFTELYNIYIIPDDKVSRQQVLQVLKNLDIQEYTAFTDQNYN